MKQKKRKNHKTQIYKGGIIIPALCNIIGVSILICVILAALPATLPKVWGYQIYHVVSGSMEPTIPVGSIAYVKNVQPEEIQENEIIAFYRGETVIIHRAMKNQIVEGTIITKGDANPKEDFEPLMYDSFIGRVEKHYPHLGNIMMVYSSNVGKYYVICFAACGAMFNILAGQLRQRRREKIKKQLEQSIKSRNNSEEASL